MEIDIRLLAPLATLFGICVSILLWTLNQRRKRLSYQVIFKDALTNARGAAGDKIQVLFEGKPVHNAQLVVVRIRNNGHVPIGPGDYVAKLAIDLGPGAHILLADVAESDPADLEDRCEHIIANVEENRVVLTPLLLNEDDSLTIQVIARNAQGAVKVSGHINGIKNITEWQPRPIMPAMLSNVGAITMAGAMLLTEPSKVMKYGVLEAIPFVLCFLLGYLLLSSGIFLGQRFKNQLSTRAWHVSL